MKSEYRTKLLKRKIFVGTKWICKTKRCQYSNNRRLGVYVQMIKKKKVGINVHLTRW
jgi:hypothetical protein